MPISENISNFIRRYKQEHHLSIEKLSEKLGIAKSATVSYLSGNCNPRADTVELIAEKCGVSAAEVISDPPPNWEQAEVVARTAKLFSSLPPERKDRAVTLFLALIDELSEGDRA